MIPESVYDLCRNRSTVSSELAINPSAIPHEIICRLFPRHTKGQEGGDGEKAAQQVKDKFHNLQQAYECGNWGSQQPSELFLQVYGAAWSDPQILTRSLAIR